MHSTTLHDLSPTEAAALAANMRYDALAEFLHALGKNLHRDSQSDEKRGRELLSLYLHRASDRCDQTAEEISAAWEICEDKMEKP